MPEKIRFNIPGVPCDIEMLKKAHSARLCVARGALPPDFDPINKYQQHVAKEIDGTVPFWNAEVVALWNTIGALAICATSNSQRNNNRNWSSSTFSDEMPEPSR